MHMNRLIALGMAALTLTIAGCTTYYKVSDPAGTKEYYTTDIDTNKAGAIRFKDEKTGSEVTLQSSDVKEISEKEFETAVRGGEGKK